MAPASTRAFTQTFDTFVGAAKNNPTLTFFGVPGDVHDIRRRGEEQPDADVRRGCGRAAFRACWLWLADPPSGSDGSGSGSGSGSAA